MTNQKIVFVLSSLQAGGSERVFWLLANELAATNQVTLVVINGANPFYTNPHPKLNLVNLNCSGASKAVWPLIKAVRAIHPDKLYVTGTHLNVLVALLKPFLAARQFIARESNIGFEMGQHESAANWRSKLTFALIPILYKRFDAVIAQSQAMQSALLQHFKIAAAKVLVIPNPCPYNAVTHQRPDPQHEVKLLAIGRFSAEKGHARLIETMQSLPENYSLAIYGYGPLQARLQSLIQELKLEHRVQLQGKATAVFELCAAADLLVLPSFTEGFPNVVLEALAVGTPVISFETGGSAELLENGVNGFIVPQSAGIKGLAAAILKAKDIKWNYDSIKNATLERFSLSRIAQAYLSLNGRKEL